MRDYSIWKEALHQLSKSHSCQLLLVAYHEGSSPGKTGFKMLVTPAHQYGTIGGGIMELNLIEHSRELMKDTRAEKIEKIEQVHRKSAPESTQSGLICAGSQTLIRIQLTQEDRNWVKQIVDTYISNNVSRLVVTNNSISIDQDASSSKYQFDKSTTGWSYYETIGKMNRVYIFGAGHVGRAISRVLSTLDFYLIINDDREDLEYLETNQYVQEKRVGVYSQLANQVESGDNIYVVITTYGFDQDFAVLKEVIRKDVRYIGLMGSSAKLNNIFSKLNSLGIDKELLERVHAPIGLDLPNETAEEIAVAVAAELIQVKNS